MYVLRQQLEEVWTDIVQNIVNSADQQMSDETGLDKMQ